MSWREFLNVYSDTLAVALAFSFGGAGFVVWLGSNKQPITPGRAMLAICAALLVASCATAFVHGHLGWSIFLAPVIGLVCGLVALPVIRTVIKGGHRVENRADDIADKAIDKVTK